MTLEKHSRYVTVLNREIHYLEWGESRNPPLLLWHGFSRNAHDFALAAREAARYRVIVPDLIGRGLSQWSHAPKQEYALKFYVELAVGIVHELGLHQFAWLGSSMGGLVGILAAAGPLRDEISSLILNDIGPAQPIKNVTLIAARAGAPPSFGSMVEFESHLRTVFVAWGRRTEAEWRQISEASMRRLPNGRLTLNHDPELAQQLTEHADELDLWPAWDRITARTLCLRGTDSAILTKETAAQMQLRGPRCEVIEIPGCGHVPSLNTPEQFALIEDFLAGNH